MGHAILLAAVYVDVHVPAPRMTLTRTHGPTRHFPIQKARIQTTEINTSKTGGFLIQKWVVHRGHADVMKASWVEMSCSSPDNPAFGCVPADDEREAGVADSFHPEAQTLMPTE